MSLHRITAAGDDLPLFGVAAIRAIEAVALAQTPPHTLMRRAGEATARLALALAPHARRFVVFAGPGNNGGDGLVAAQALHARGHEVLVLLHGDPQRMPDDARDAHRQALAAGVPMRAPGTPVHVGPDDLALDALLGLGVRRPADGAIAASIDALNALPCTVLAVDLPSGLDADTGQPVGTLAVRAHHTLTMLAAKPGLFTGAGRDHAGAVWLADLEIGFGGAEPTAWLARSAGSPAPARRHAQHKGSFGDVAVVGGAAGMVGAALLAARAAQAAGAGRVFVDLLAPHPPAHDPARPELMLRAGWLAATDAAALGRSTVVCGCGGGDAVAAQLPKVLARAARLVLDADALNLIAGDTGLRGRLVGRGARGLATVLTPHPLEAARLLGSDSTSVQADRLKAAQALADELECVVVLKGSGTVIASPGHAPFVNPTGCAALASGGTGDVLAGWIGGLWAQQPMSPDAASTAARRAVYAHGAAADRHAGAVLRAADLIERMAEGR